MALQGFIAASQQYVLVSFSKFPPKILSHGHRLPNSVRSGRSTLQTKACLATQKTNNEIIRPISIFQPSLWGDTFVDPVLLSTSEMESNIKLRDELKGKVKEMLMASKDDAVENVGFINLLCRLGVSYHFETEMEQQLDHIFEENPNILLGDNDYDLHTVSLLFRVFRQHGYNISCDVFSKFLDTDGGKFKENLKSDIRGMLSLYEASHLRVHGEDILEEALAFTTTHLKSFLGVLESSNPEFHLADHIGNAMRQSLHRSIARLEAYRYINFYQGEESRNETLLLFAKFDFNQVQLLHRRELSELTRWWKDLKSTVKLPNSRDIIVELYFFVVGNYFEPCYSDARLILVKFEIMITLIDDMFDSYGTFDELQCFEDAVQRWDASAIDELPEYLKPLYSALLNLFEEFDDHTSKEGRTYSASYAIDGAKGMIRGYLVEAMWWNEGKIPSFEDYMSNGIVTAGCIANATAALLGMKEVAGINEFEWLKTKPKISRASYSVSRLMDDIGSQEREQRREDVASGIQCYMNEYGVTEEEAIEAIMNLVEDAWKDMNEVLCMIPTKVVPLKLLIAIMNYARASDTVYKHGNDGFTGPKSLVAYVKQLFIDHIPIYN